MDHNRWKVNQRDITKNFSQHNLKNNATQLVIPKTKIFSSCSILISSPERIWKGSRESSELNSDNISNCEQDPESDAKLVRFKLRVS